MLCSFTDRFPLLSNTPACFRRFMNIVGPARGSFHGAHKKRNRSRIANKACMFATGPCCLLPGSIYSNHSEVYIDGSPYFGNNYAQSGGEIDQLKNRQLTHYTRPTSYIPETPTQTPTIIVSSHSTPSPLGALSWLNSSRHCVRI